MKRAPLFIFVSLMAGLLYLGSVSPVFAIADPASVSVQKAQAFTSVIEANDVLFLAKFQITYTNCDTVSTTGCPAESVTTAFLGHLIDDDGSCTGLGTAHLRSKAPFTSSAPGFNGYGQGVFSIYLTASEATTLAVDACPESHALEIQGNPSVFPDVTNIVAQLQVATPLSKPLLPQAVLNRAGEIQTSWGVDLLQTSDTKLNATGEDYFEASISNLREIAPSIFPAGILTPDVLDREFNKTYKTGLEGFGSGFAIMDNANGSFDALETDWGIPAIWLKSIIAMIVTGAMVVAVLRSTGDTRVALLAAPFGFAGFTLIGFMALEFMALITVFAALALGYMFFLKDA